MNLVWWIFWNGSIVVGRDLDRKQWSKVLLNLVMFKSRVRHREAFCKHKWNWTDFWHGSSAGSHGQFFPTVKQRGCKTILYTTSWSYMWLPGSFLETLFVQDKKIPWSTGGRWPQHRWKRGHMCSSSSTWWRQGFSVSSLKWISVKWTWSLPLKYKEYLSSWWVLNTSVEISSISSPYWREFKCRDKS